MSKRKFCEGLNKEKKGGAVVRLYPCLTKDTRSYESKRSCVFGVNIEAAMRELITRKHGKDAKVRIQTSSFAQESFIYTYYGGFDYWVYDVFEELNAQRRGGDGDIAGFCWDED